MAETETLIKFSVTSQRTRLAKFSKCLIASIIDGVIKNAAGFILAGLVERLAVFQQLTASLQISVSRPAPGRCPQILAIIPRPINFTLPKNQLPITLSFPLDALRLHGTTSSADKIKTLRSCNLADERQNIFQTSRIFNMANTLAKSTVPGWACTSDETSTSIRHKLCARRGTLLRERRGKNTPEFTIHTAT
jgi:hypothetical protein